MYLYGTILTRKWLNWLLKKGEADTLLHTYNLRWLRSPKREREGLTGCVADLKGDSFVHLFYNDSTFSLTLH